MMECIFKVLRQSCVVLSLIVLAQVISSNAHMINKRQSGNEETTVEPLTTTQNSTMSDNGDKSNTGAVVAASVIAVVLCIGIVIVVFIIRKRRQSMMMDKEKKMQIQMSSARNAGVYQDLTVSVPIDDKPPASPEHERLKAAEEA